MPTSTRRRERAPAKRRLLIDDADAHAREAVRVHLRIAACYNLLMREARVRIFERWGLTLPQFDVLAELARADGGGFTIVELSRLLLVTSGNLTGIVDRLEARQLVRREPDPTDRRMLRLRLTEKGRALTDEILPRHRQDLDKLLRFMPLQGLTRLAALLDRLKKGLATASGKAPNKPSTVRRAELTAPEGYDGPPERMRRRKFRSTRDNARM